MNIQKVLTSSALFIALPLSLGTTSEGEYIDIELKISISELEIKDRLNSVFPQGLKVKEPKFLKENIKIVTADGAENIYISKEKLSDHFYQKTKEFFEQKEIWVEKRGKKESKKINIKDKIFDYSIRENKDSWIINLLLSAGSKDNLKAEIVIKALYEYNLLDFKEYEIDIHRIDIFQELTIS